jgi:aryl-alcohol dehydrogenase-like predicted oxidoreductase
MEYVKLGSSGLEVSRICLGCMSYGVPELGNHPWTLKEEDSRPFVKQASTSSTLPTSTRTAPARRSSGGR